MARIASGKVGAGADAAEILDRGEELKQVAVGVPNEAITDAEVGVASRRDDEIVPVGLEFFPSCIDVVDFEGEVPKASKLEGRPGLFLFRPQGLGAFLLEELQLVAVTSDVDDLKLSLRNVGLAALFEPQQILVEGLGAVHALNRDTDVMGSSFDHGLL